MSTPATLEQLGERRLQVARLIGAVAVAEFGQMAVHHPGGYFGDEVETTPLGLVYALVMLIGGGFAALGIHRGRTWGTVLALVLLSLTIGVFVPTLNDDPIVAGFVIVWQLGSMLRQLFPPLRSVLDRSSFRLDDLDPVDTWLLGSGAAAQYAVQTAFVLTLAIVGFELTLQRNVQYLALASNLAVLAAVVPFWRLQLRAGSRMPWLVLVIVLAAIGMVGTPRPALATLAMAQLVTLGVLASQRRMIATFLNHAFSRPAMLLVGSFGATILLGAMVLSFPAASATGVPIDPLSALFTATSAVCVTGLIVLDTPNAFSTFGHAVIVCLIQMGGLGIMVLSSFAALVIGGRLGVRGETALRDILGLEGFGSALRLTRFIVLSTFAIEGIGALLLAWAFHGHGMPTGQALWHGLFHAVSAFCNAGFSLWSDSVMQYADDPFILGVHMALVALGGLGFTVLAAIWLFAIGKRDARTAVQMRIVVWGSLAIGVIGWLMFLATEWNTSLHGFGTFDRLWNGLFQSMATRTAGFNSVDAMEFRSSTNLLLIVLMFIGAAPGGTGGGIKITTFAILVAAVPSIARGEAQVVLFGRRIPQEVVYRAAAIVLITMTFLLAGLFALLLTHDLPMERLAFETTSAIATVGLSLNTTSELNPFGRVVIIVMMFVGRIGPLTMTLIFGGKTTSAIKHPTTNVMVG